MKKLRNVGEKTILYQRHDFLVNWANEMPIENWLLMVVADDKPTSVLDEIARKSIDKDVCYVCCLGEQSEKLHDTFDDIITLREVEIEHGHLPAFHIMTTWHNDFEEGVWFATFVAEDDEQEIKTVFCLDAGKESSEKRITELIGKISQGWLPGEK